MPAENFTTPVGRLVQGSLYTPNDKDADGNLRLYKTGPNMGKPRPEYYVALAIPKTPGQHWATSDWGAKIWAAGHRFIGHAGQMPTFAWKIRDGDSTVPNKKNKRPVDQPGFPGNWIVSFSSGFAPKVYSLIGVKEPQLIETKDAVNLGDFVQINGNVDGNDSPQQPGVYLNLSMVCLVGYGERIVLGPDVSAAGFGGAPLPAGASMTPPAGFSPPMAPTGTPLPPGMPAAPGTAYGGAPTPTPPAPTATAPYSTALPPPTMMPPPVANPAFLGLPPPPPVAGVAPPPVAPAHVMLPAAKGVPYEQYIAAGWNDATLIQHGLMAA